MLSDFRSAHTAMVRRLRLFHEGLHDSIAADPHPLRFITIPLDEARIEVAASADGINPRQAHLWLQEAERVGLLTVSETEGVCLTDRPAATFERVAIESPELQALLDALTAQYEAHADNFHRQEIITPDTIRKATSWD